MDKDYFLFFRVTRVHHHSICNTFKYASIINMPRYSFDVKYHSLWFSHCSHTAPPKLKYEPMEDPPERYIVQLSLTRFYVHETNCSR